MSERTPNKTMEKKALKKLTLRQSRKMPVTKQGSSTPIGPLVSVPSPINNMAQKGMPFMPRSYHR